MPGVPNNATRRVLLCLPAALVLSACETEEGRRVKETQAKLVGEWVRDGQADGLDVKRLLVLAKDGKFTEQILVTTANGQLERKEFAGEWSYDGTNLKRRFLKENGRQYSGGGIRFATFPLISVSATEFVVQDTVTATRTSYRRKSGESST